MTSSDPQIQPAFDPHYFEQGIGEFDDTCSQLLIVKC